MKRIATVCSVVLVASSAFAVWSSSGTAGTTPRAAQRLVVLEVERGLQIEFVDRAPTQSGSAAAAALLTAGDRFTFSAPIFKTDRRTRIGLSSEECVITRNGTRETAEFLCTAAYRLPGGMITTTTSYVGSDDARTASITGGTSTYSGASGSTTTTLLSGASRVQFEIDA